MIPHTLPHKRFDGASLEDRILMLEAVSAGEPRFGIAISDGGLYIDIARECKQSFHLDDVWFLCGRDAAERICEWDYGEERSVASMLAEFGLLVAPRAGEYSPPDDLTARARLLPLPGQEDVSSTSVRERIRAGQEWKSLVPPEIADLVERIYK